MPAEYADSSVWDRIFTSQGDLDWGGLWTSPFIELLQQRQCRRILDLGCGTGNDVARLTEVGFRVTGLDFSEEAIVRSRSKEIPGASFVVADMAEPLPFSDDHFDAVMSNVALHMFDNRTTRRVVDEVARVLQSGGLFLFHVNSTDDRALRARRKRVVQELAENLILEEGGQTVRFFSRRELEALFATWSSLNLVHMEIPNKETSRPFKRVWRGLATI